MSFRSIPPTPRSSPFIVSVHGKAYLWGGHSLTDAASDPHAVYTYSINTEKWMREIITKGSLPPAGLHAGSCSDHGQYGYVYGGKHGSGYSGALYQLDTVDLAWRELSDCSTDGPMLKYGCRSLIYKNSLLLFGGEGPEPDSIQHKSIYEGNYTNELHSYDFTLESWIDLEDSGSRPPPCSEFSWTMIEKECAVLFGGWLYESCSNSVYMLELAKMNWRLLPHKDGVPWPEGRSSHASVCLGFGGSSSHLLVIGGCNHLGKALDDMWLLDPRTGIWKEVPVPNKAAVQRLDHGATLFQISPECVEILLFGGRRSWGVDSPIADTAVLRFELVDSPLSSEKRKVWVLKNITDHTQLGTHERLEEKKKKWRSPSMFSSMIEVGSRAKELKLQLVEMETAAEENAIALAKSSKRAEDLLKKTAKLEATVTKTKQVNEEKSKEVELLMEELRLSQERTTTSDNDWVVRREEIIMTGPELGRGGWATVSVATFRGTQVAAKSIHNVIVSPHNIELFRREMNMAARLRHPNLVQFIGATNEGNLLFLTELMPISLRKQLEVDIYLQPNHVKSIGLDVARALNYMHLMKPDPLIHRDISSSNVLLEQVSLVQYRAKVADYGSVNVVRELHTQSPGSPAYAAPEANNPNLQSPKMDVYSFGALLLEMLTGQLPTRTDRPILLRKVHHEQLLTIIRRCLNDNRDSRPDASTIIILLRDQHVYSVV